MKIVILTSSRKGTAAYCLPVLLERSKAEIVQVIYNEGVITNRSRYYRQKFKKLLKIGLPGAINGIRMRKWFSVKNIDGKEIEDIESICKRNNIPFASTPGINNPRTIELISACSPDLGLSLGNSYISSKVFSVPRYGMLNLHGEILPQFQNAQSVIWQIYEGNTETGYTIHKVEKKIDTGEILKQDKFPITFKNTLGETISATCSEIIKRSALGFADVLDNFDRYYRERKVQGQGKIYTTPSLKAFFRIVANFNRIKKDAFSTKKTL